MSKYYVFLLDSDNRGRSHCRGDIVEIKQGEAPLGMEWASFDPPEGLQGTPELAHVADNGTGDLVFRYTIAETDGGFIIRARVGMPRAVAVIGSNSKSPARDHDPPKPDIEPVLEFGAGLAMTSGRSFVGWTGPSKAEPEPKVEYDPLRHGFDDGIDHLRKGFE